MEYIPITRIGSNIDIIDSLPIPHDLIKNIKTYCDDYLSIPINKVGYEVDEFWIKLGIETCNIYRWNLNCMFIQNARVFSALEKQLNLLRSLLDDLVCNSYPRSIHSIKYDNREIYITNIFYNIADIIKYPVNTYKITLQDKNYIINFIERTKNFLDFLEENIDKLPVNVENFKEKTFYNETIKNIKKQIKKILKKKLFTMKQ
jgi:hypothetical protein